ncbi:hypothetical protein [Streptomyces lydicus]|uniref:hypothetical protein n=1 Tax=Streptomyces lydicus TaxID=47763 RepID=UPI0037AB3CB9
MPDQPTGHSVRIDAQPGHASIRIDDHEVGEYVLGYTIQHDIHSALPQMVIHTRQPAGTLFDAFAQVVVAADARPADTIRAFLRTINPIELEQAALERGDLGDERYGLTRAMLAQLAEWADERSA